MICRSLIGAIATLAAMGLSIADCQAWDDTKYPNLKGQWHPVGGPTRFDGSKLSGAGQQAPLTPEYRDPF